MGNPDSSVLLVVVFWTVFYVWAGSEFFLGWRITRRKTADTVESDAGSKWILISSIWFGVAIGIGLAALAPWAAITHGRHQLFAAGSALALAGMALRWYSIWFLGRSFTCEVATRQGEPYRRYMRRTKRLIPFVI